MFKNHFKAAFRNLLRNKAHSFINIAGLSVGMAVAVTIGIWIWDELSFDSGFEHYKQIAQVMQTETHNGQMNTGKGNVMPLAAELRTNYGSDFLVSASRATFVRASLDPWLPSRCSGIWRNSGSRRSA